MEPSWVCCLLEQQQKRYIFPETFNASLFLMDLQNIQDPDAGKDWRQEKGTAEDEAVEWHHQLDGHEFEQAPGAGDGQGSPACYFPWGRKELDTTEWLNWAELNPKLFKVQRTRRIWPTLKEETVNQVPILRCLNVELFRPKV